MALAGATEPARAESFLDQEFDPFTNGPKNAAQGFGVGFDVAQTFTVGRTGTLSRIEVLIRVTPGVTDELSVDVRTTNGGVPAEANTAPPVLASTTAPAASIPNDHMFVSFDLSSANVAVSAGDVLAIVLRSGSGGLGLVGYGRSGTSFDAYAGGAAFFRNSNVTAAWTHLGAVEYGFRTFVEPAPCFGSPVTIAGSGKIVGTPDEDVIAGSPGNDVIDGRGGPDAICGLEGDDRISSRNLSGIAVDGGPGDDRIKLSGAGGTNVSGGDGADTIAIKLTDGDNLVAGGAGSDVIKTTTVGGTNDVDGGEGDDRIKVSAKGGANAVVGGPGIDTCRRGKGAIAPGDVCEN